MAASRPVWKGLVSFGLVSVPAQLFSYEAKESEIDFTMLDRRDQQRIRYLRVNAKTGREVAWRDIVKGFEVDTNKYVIVTPQDLKNSAPKATKTIEIVDFVSRDEVDPWYFERPYVLVPVEQGHKVYGLLCAALEDSDRIGIAKVVLHTRQHLAALITNGSSLMLVTMRFADELRRPEDFESPEVAAAPAKAPKRELDLAKTLIDGMTVAWDPTKYHDEYRESLTKWLAKRAKSGDTAAIDNDEDDEAVAGPYNIMDLLKKSIDGRKKGSRRRTPPSRSRAAG
jgi:DNA end-binding protein Ku